MFAGRLNQVGPVMTNGSILWFQPIQVPLLQHRGLRITWRKLGSTRTMMHALAVAIWRNHCVAPLVHTHHLGNMRHPVRKRPVMSVDDPEESNLFLKGWSVSGEHARLTKLVGYVDKPTTHLGQWEEPVTRQVQEVR